jgi:hypothetical protein
LASAEAWEAIGVNLADAVEALELDVLDPE